jgi:hypothetical protein
MPNEARELLFNVALCLDDDLSDAAGPFWRLTRDDSLQAEPGEDSAHEKLEPEISHD